MKTQNDVIQDMINESKRLCVYSNTNQVYTYAENKQGVILSDNILIPICSNTDDISIRIVRDNKEYDLYYPTSCKSNANLVTNLIKHTQPIKYRLHMPEKQDLINVYGIEYDDTDYMDILLKKAKEIKTAILDLASDIKITDFQLTYTQKQICITNTFGLCKYICSPEATFEVEIQKKLGDNTILGSSYIYKRCIEDIKTDDIISDVSFPLKFDSYNDFDTRKKYNSFVFGHPIMASILENITYYNLMKKPIMNPSSAVNIWNNPFAKDSPNYYPFDDNGHSNKKTLLYGNGENNSYNYVKSHYKISARSINRSASACLQRHPDNIVIEGKKHDLDNLFSDINCGVYCHLIVGNHYCYGDYIEGTVFNGCEIIKGKMVRALKPFKIKINKMEFLNNISALGNDTSYTRAFPYWTPMLALTPTVAVNNIKIN